MNTARIAADRHQPIHFNGKNIPKPVLVIDPREKPLDPKRAALMPRPVGVLTTPAPGPGAEFRKHARVQRANRRSLERKATRAYRRKVRVHGHERANALGMARIYYDVDGAGTRNPELRRNVSDAVRVSAETIAAKQDISLEKAYEQISAEFLALVEPDLALLASRAH